MTKSISNGQKAASDFMRGLGLHPDYHVAASLANVVLGHSIHHESAVRDVKLFLHREGVKVPEEKIEELVHVTRGGLG